MMPPSPSLFAAGPTDALGRGGILWLIPALLAGAGAIYVLLPRPRPLRTAPGLALALLALVLAGAFVVPVGAASTEAVLFYAYSGLALVSAGMLVTQSNPARAALAFALVILATCGLFLILAAPFLMAATIVIYAGAIVVTFLFVLMLAHQEGPSDADSRSREPALATLTGFLLLGVLLYVLRGTYAGEEIEPLIERAEAAATYDNKTDVNRAVGEVFDESGLFRAYLSLLERRGLTDLVAQVQADQTAWVLAPDVTAQRRVLERLVAVARAAQTRLPSLSPASAPGGTRLPLSPLSGSPATEAPGNVRRDASGRPAMPAENATYLGRSLFSDFLLPVELGGTLLLIATVGAIAIAHRRAAAEGRAS